MRYFIVFILYLFIYFDLYANSELFKLDLEDLSNIQIESTSVTLTKTNIKNTPASITIITHKDIVDSGARNLDELLEIYVPSFNYMNKVYGSQLGFRGIISDRNNKILLLVNGRVMNIKTTDGGVITERWFSTLGDIQSIKVITGSGSAIYGSGAIAGVISIETFSGKEKNGISVSTSGGLGEEFYNAEVSYGSKIQDDMYMYIYYGVDKYKSSDDKDAPLKFAFDYGGEHSWNQDIYAPADERYPYKTTNDYGSLQNKLRHKVHFQIDSDTFTFWARFTQSSLATPTIQTMFQNMSKNNSEKFKDTGTKNRQITLFLEKTHRLLDNLLLTYQMSYLRSDVFSNFYDAEQLNRGDKFWGEDNLMGKILLNYEINDENKLAIGGEYNYNWYGRKSDLSSSGYSKTGILPNATKWENDLISFFAEYQSNFINNTTLFIGTRVDKHKYSSPLYSPRIDFVYNSDGQDVIKVGFNRSLRYSDEASLYENHNRNNTFNDVEQIDTIELIYTKYIDNSIFNFSTFYNKHDLVAWNNNNKITQNMGNVKSYGAEMEFNYKNDNFLFNLSHSYVKLYKFQLKDDTLQVQNISSSVYGYGDDFANWNEHITKMRFNYNFSKKIKWTNSLRVFWGLDGAKDMAEYNKDLSQTTSKYIMPYYDYGHTRAFKESIYLNSALIWKLNKQTTLTLHGYNLLGLIDKDYNKRNFFQTTSQYRDAAPSVSVGLKYTFD
jgi:iron complex outermembrane receptor protein